MIEDMQVDWNDLSSVHCQFAITKASTNSPLCSRKELEVFLEWWVDKKWKLSGALGNIQPLWELVRILKLYEPKRLLQILDEINDSWEDEAARSHDHNYTYSSLPTTLTTYVVEKIESTIQVDQLLQSRSGDGLLRYQIEVIRNTFLWLDDLLPTLSSWVGALFGNDEKSLIPKEQSPCETEETILDQITWLSLARTMDFLKGRGCLDDEDLMQLSGLWKILHDNNQMPIKYAFRLAVVGAKGNWQDELAWYKFNTDIRRPLLDAAGSPIYGNITEIFVHFYTRLGKQPDALGLTWTKEELEELGEVYAVVAAGSDIKQNLSGYPVNPAGAVASVLPEVSPEDIIRHDVCPPIISGSKQLVAISGEPCSIRASILVASERGILIMQRDQKDSYGGEWEFPGGQINAGERVSEGSERELGEETSLEGQIRLYSYDTWDGRKDGRKWYQFNSFAKVNRDEPGWEKCIQLSEEHQGFAWIKQKEWSKFAPGREKNIQEGLSAFAFSLIP